jgi:hypothetical protein
VRFFKNGARQKYGVDVGYERFLAPEIFFNPEIYSSDFLTPLPDIVDDVIQQSPIDVRRGLYKVFFSIFFFLVDAWLTRRAEHRLVWWLYHVSTLWSEAET